MIRAGITILLAFVLMAIATDQMERAERKRFEREEIQNFQPTPSRGKSDLGRPTTNLLLDTVKKIRQQEGVGGAARRLIRGWDFNEQTYRYYSELEVRIMREAASYNSSGDYLYTPWFYRSGELDKEAAFERQLEEYIDNYLEEILDEYGD